MSDGGSPFQELGPFWSELGDLITSAATLATKCVLFERAGEGAFVDSSVIVPEVSLLIDRINAAVLAVKGNRPDGTHMTLTDARRVVAAIHRTVYEYLDEANEVTDDAPEG